MNEHDEQSLERQLELATSLEAVDPTLLDHETAEMRSAWQALTELLEAARLDDDSPILETQRTLRPYSWIPGKFAVASVAVVLLLSLTGAWMYRYLPVEGDQVTFQETRSDDIAPSEVDRSWASSDDERLTEDHFSWNDSALDRQIALVELDLYALEQEDDAVDSMVESLYDQLDAWELEFEQSTL